MSIEFRKSWDSRLGKTLSLNFSFMENFDNDKALESLYDLDQALEHEVDLLDQHKAELTKKEVDDISDEICIDMKRLFDGVKRGVTRNILAKEIIGEIIHLNHLILKDD